MFVFVAEPKVVLKGELRVDTEMYHSSLGVIIFRGNIVYTAKHYDNIPILRLSLKRRPTDIETEYTEVKDEYCFEFPYLKAMADFRKLLAAELETLIYHPELLIREGAKQYLEKIRTYTDEMSLVRQAKNAVEKLSNKKSIEQKAREILKILGITPYADYTFEQVEPDATVWQSLTPMEK